MNFKGRNIISIRDFEKDEIEYVLKKAFEVKENKFPDALSVKF